MNDDLMKQFLLAALMCGETIANDVNLKCPDLLEEFMRRQDGNGYDLFRSADDLGLIAQIDGRRSDWVVTDKGKEFLK